MEKSYYEELVGHNIRLDTYYMVEEMLSGLNHDEAKAKVQKEHGEEEGIIKVKKCFVKEPTILNIIKLCSNINVKPCNNFEYNFKGTNINNGYGIYCIKDINDEIIYVGMTERSFIVRWSEHLQHIKNKDKSLFLYSYLKQQNIRTVTFLGHGRCN